MNEPLIDLVLVATAFLLILANAFFVAAEFALVSVRRTRIEELVSQGSASARVVKRVVQDPDRFIAATQLGITIASLALGWIGEPAIAHLIEPLFGFLPENLVAPATTAVAATLIAFSLITFLHVVIGELAPKSVALSHPENAALFVARPMIFFENIFRPAIWVLNGAGNALVKALGLSKVNEDQSTHSVAELKMIVNASATSGELEPVEREIAQRAFEFADKTAEAVMVPRTDMRAVEDTDTVDDFLALFAQVSHSRFPVYTDSIDNIVGFVWVKDILRALALKPNSRQLPMNSVMRQALFVPGAKPIGDLLSEMQRQKAQLAIVVDEYGGTAGMVTIEELIEEIVGRVSDELAATPPPVRQMEGGQIEADAMLGVDEANAQLGIDLPESDDYETLAGLVMTRMGRVPQEGESVRVGAFKLTAAKMNGPRIEKVIISRIPDKRAV